MSVNVKFKIYININKFVFILTVMLIFGYKFDEILLFYDILLTPDSGQYIIKCNIPAQCFPVLFIFAAIYILPMLKSGRIAPSAPFNNYS